MLLQFIVENFRSFREEAVLNLIPSNTSDHPSHVLTDDEGKTASALSTAVLYGANASGKSNLVKAIEFAQNLISTGTEGSQLIPTTPFVLDTEYSAEPSRFEFVLKSKGILYKYGFAVTTDEVREEWLSAILNVKEVMLFERKTEDNKTSVDIGNQLASKKDDKQLLQFIAKSTRPNQLFLTEAARERNVESLKPIYHWFQDNLQILTPEMYFQALAVLAKSDDNFRDFMCNFLQLADTGVESITVIPKKLNFRESFPEMPLGEIDKLRLSLKEPGRTHIVTKKGNEFYTLGKDDEDPSSLFLNKLMTQHRSSTNELIAFETVEESDGTQRLMHLIPALMDMHENEKVYVIDEIDRSMHPMLTKHFLEIFLKTKANPQAMGQLIFTTHETHLMDLGTLRRDEIWFLERDRNGGSHLSSLIEFKARKDLKIDKHYLSGRFGAIPYLGDPEKLGIC